MRNSEISRRLQSLRDLISSTSRACAGDVEMQAHWAKYLCVLSAGLVEYAVKELYGGFIRKGSNPAVASYAVSSILTMNNPNNEKILQLAGAFRSNWRTELEAFSAENGRKEAINSLMKQRHLIAHGKNSDITIIRLKEYLGRIEELLEQIELQCLR